MKLNAGAFILLSAIASCTSGGDDPITPTVVDQPDDTTGDSTPPQLTPAEQAIPNPTFFIVGADGRYPDAGFATREDAYLNAVSGQLPYSQGPTPAGPPVVAGDYFFDVTSGGGSDARPGSTDDRSCRRFHVDSEGTIDQVYAGLGGCQHGFVTDPHPYEKGGKLLIQLAPFLYAPVYEGEINGTYCVSFEREDGGPSPLDGICFFVQATCGDGSVSEGEACDDANTADGDGCSGTCQLEPDCPVVL